MISCPGIAVRRARGPMLWRGRAHIGGEERRRVVARGAGGEQGRLSFQLCTACTTAGGRIIRNDEQHRLY